LCPLPLEKVPFYSSTTSGMGLFYSSTTSVIGLFLFIHNLCHRSFYSLKRDPYQRLWMNENRPIPEVVDE
jgi:hypothetical protein